MNKLTPDDMPKLAMMVREMTQREHDLEVLIEEAKYVCSFDQESEPLELMMAAIDETLNVVKAIQLKAILNMEIIEEEAAS